MEHVKSVTNIYPVVTQNNDTTKDPRLQAHYLCKYI